MNLLIVVSGGRTILAAFGRTLTVSCVQADRIVEKLPVIYSLNADGSQGYPYMPKPFPLGLCNATGARQSDDPELAPWVLETDAHQKVERWEVTEDGKDYVQPIGDFVEDWGYEFHFDRIWMTTDGCVRMASAEDATWLCQQYLAAKTRGDTVQVSVLG